MAASSTIKFISLKLLEISSYCAFLFVKQSNEYNR